MRMDWYRYEQTPRQIVGYMMNQQANLNAKEKLTAGMRFRELLKVDGPLVMPGAYDGLSARLIKQVGFESLFVSGFSVVGARYGVPDIGLKGLGEISDSVRAIIAASDLPALVDCDDGYGDVKNVVHTLHTYERMGVAGVFLEDQRWPKRCGHMAGKIVVSIEEMEAKIHAAVSERMFPETIIVARTDARAVNGLDDALRRAERCSKAGADVIFIEALQSIEEYERVGKLFDLQVANPLEGGVSPIFTPQEYFKLGFKILPYGISLILRITKTLQLALEDIRSGRFELMKTGASFQEYLKIVGLEEWAAVEMKHTISNQ